MSTFPKWKGSHDVCSLSEFKANLQNPHLPSKIYPRGWVFWDFKTENELEKEKLQCVVEAVSSRMASLSGCEYMVQFWAHKEGHLTTVDQPFGVVGRLYKGYSWYRKHSEDRHYSVKEGASEEEVGPVGRAYLSSNPESSPDLRLYSINEFPLLDVAAGCGFRNYLALPLSDSLKKESYGVLEMVSDQTCGTPSFFLLNQGLKCYSPEPEGEIEKMMESAMKLVPQLHMVQVWSPCEHFTNTSNNLSYMQRIAFIEAQNKTLGSCGMDSEMWCYLQACEFHHPQIGKWMGSPLKSGDRKSCFCRNICDFGISENPLAHYAQRARLSFSFVVHLQDKFSDKHLLVEFFFQSNSREEGCDASFLHLLLKIMEMELTDYKFEKSIVELRKTSGLTPYEYVEWEHRHSEEVNTSMVMKYHREKCTFLGLKHYLEKTDLSCLQKCEEGKKQGWLFGRKEIYHHGINNNTGLHIPPTQETVNIIMTEIAAKWEMSSYTLVQFWGVGMNENKRCLQTLDEPFALGSLDKGLVFFRKQCMAHLYFVDEEVSPLQRVFRSGHTETSPDLRLYSATEFPLRDDALSCLLTKYLAFPVYDQHKICIGVLECVGDNNECEMTRCIEGALKVASLGLMYPSSIMVGPTSMVDPSQTLANTEICRALELFKNIPQLFHADVWITCNECDGISSNTSCMELFQSLKGNILGWPPISSHVVQSTKGIVGMVLSSENKSCFYRNLCDFSIATQPFAHYAQQARLGVCFAICLQSSYTGDILYVLQFFLHQGPANYKYISSFLHNLFPILKQELTSFKVASGHQLGDDLVVDVIEFPQGNQVTSSELNDSHSPPFKFKTVLYGQKEIQYSNDELHDFVPDVMDTVPGDAIAIPSSAETSDAIDKAVAKEKHVRKRYGSLNITLDVLEPQHSNNHFVPDVMDSLWRISRAKPSEAAASDSKEKDVVNEKVGRKGKEIARLLSLEDLEPHIGKSRKKVAQELEVGISTIWRACKVHGIIRWSTNEKYMKKLFKSIRTSQHSLCPLEMDQPPSTAKTTLQPATELQQDSQIMTVKVVYEADEIKFELCLPLKLDKLFKEVVRRINLEAGSFKLRYLDEENRKILLTIDEDLQLCLMGLQAGNKTCMQVFVELILRCKPEKVLVKAMYEADEIKFELCLSSAMDKFVEEVARRLNFEIGSFKLRYLDEDNRNILLAVDEDLQLCLKGLTSRDRTCMQVFVELIQPKCRCFGIEERRRKRPASDQPSHSHPKQYAYNFLDNRKGAYNEDEHHDSQVEYDFVNNLAKPVTTTLVEPKPRIDTRGGPKASNLGSDASTKHDPCLFENQQSGIWICLTDDEDSEKQTPIIHNHTRSSSLEENLISLIPAIFQPHIVECKNVESDGHCGFRAVAALVGYGEGSWARVRLELMDELKNHTNLYKVAFKEDDSVEEILGRLNCFTNSDVPSKNWFMLPYMGYLVASAYNVAFITLSTDMSLTFLPLRSAVTLPPTAICVGLCGNHFIPVTLGVGHPLPPIANSWFGCHRKIADGWKEAYYGSQIS